MLPFTVAQSDEMFNRLEALFLCRGVTDLSTVVHMTPLEEIEQSSRCWRSRVHVYPRRPRLSVDRAGAENRFQMDTVGVMSENSAAVFGN